ncbi:MAG: YczE/YyaS/YitT family protein [Ruminococcus sp.]|jgi:uncharacterized membrane protein YczE
MNKLPQRYFCFFLGLAVNSFGVAFITKSALGTSQISSIPYVFSLHFPQISFGMFTFIYNMIFILIEIAILKKDFKPIQFLQIAANLLFSGFIDLSMYLLAWFSPDALPLRLFSLIIGCIILAVGISIEVAPDVIVVPGEGVVRAIAQTSRKDFGKVKVYFDVTLIIIAAIFSFLFFHRLRGLGAGTIISAVTVGKLVSFVDHHFPLIRYIQKMENAGPVKALPL